MSRAVVGTQRNRTNLFQMFRNLKQGGDIEAGPEAPTNGGRYNNDVLLIKQNLGQIQSLFSDIRDGPVQVLDDEVEQSLKQTKYQTTLKITDLLKQTKSAIVKLSQYKEREIPNIQSSLLVELGQLSKEFQTIQQQNLDNIRRCESYITPLELDEDQLQQVNLLDFDITTREKEIQQIATSITELSELMQDIARLVQSQGEILDHIEYNVEHAAEDVQQGTQEIKKAEVHQKNGRKFYCILFLLLLLFVTILIVLIKVLA